MSILTNKFTICQCVALYAEKKIKILVIYTNYMSTRNNAFNACKWRI